RCTADRPNPGRNPIARASDRTRAFHIANLRDQGINLVVKIEIEAVASTGFDENMIRTVSENAKTLKFEQSGFESE
ncbi:hypothetical protein, partial [Mycolicibacterium conceptionense]|uniref:hypothetical protein n=1 Tax=Mycolicibacterium conceptionense TaxID=451644 RepID=UPI0010543B11